LRSEQRGKPIQEIGEIDLSCPKKKQREISPRLAKSKARFIEPMYARLVNESFAQVIFRAQKFRELAPLKLLAVSRSVY
jgi:hypothetical protein